MNLDSFEGWRTNLEDAIKDFLSLLPPEIQPKMDYSAASLTILEHWILQTYSPGEESNKLINAPEITVHDGLFYYLGETFRKQIGGYWNVHFSKVESDYRYGEEPVVEGFFQDMTVSPLSLFAAVLGKRDGQYLKRVLEMLIMLYGKKNS